MKVLKRMIVGALVGGGLCLGVFALGSLWISGLYTLVHLAGGAERVITPVDAHVVAGITYIGATVGALMGAIMPE